MKNLAPSTLAALPPAHGALADLEHAFAARRVELVETVRAASLAGRILHVLHVLRSKPEGLAQPTMCYVTSHGSFRTQPRDRSGRFLSRTWLRNAEAFLPADLAWFRSAVPSTEGK